MISSSVCLHEVIQEILPSVLVVSLFIIILSEHIIISMIFLPLLLLIFLGLSSLFFPLPIVSILTHSEISAVSYPLQHSGLIFLPQILQLLFLFHLQVRELFNLRLVQTIDNRIFSCRNQYSLDLTHIRFNIPLQQKTPDEPTYRFLVFEADLSYSHTAVLL